MKEILETRIKNYEKTIKDLIGKSIVDINYYELDYGKPLWNEVEYHSLDYGLEIIISDLECYYFIWGNEFAQFDLKFRKGNILEEFISENAFKKYNVRDNSYWQDLIGKEISGIKSNWSYWSLVGSSEKKQYPQHVEIEFENGKTIWISVVEIIEGKPFVMKDHISVFFSREVFEKVYEE